MAEVQQPHMHLPPSFPRRPLNAPILSPRPITQPLQTAVYKNGHFNLDTFSPVDQNGSFCFDRVIKSGAVLRRIKKKGSWKPSWKPAYLVLRPNLLSIYKNQDETDLRASIALSDVTAIATVRKSHLDNVFGVFSPAKNYHFQASSQTEATDWVNQIRLEAHTDELDLDGLDPPAPLSAKDPHALAAHDDTTDVSADESPDPPGSPDAPAWVVRERPPATTNPAATRPRGTSRSNNMAGYSTNEAFTTSHSSFSDFAPGSLPKTYLANHNPKTHPPLSPIASNQQLRPAQPHRNTSQLSINIQLDSPDRVIHQGHLSILRASRTFPNVHTWKTLWVVLRPRNLCLYKTEAEYSVVDMIPMASVIDVVEIEPLDRKGRPASHAEAGGKKRASSSATPLSSSAPSSSRDKHRSRYRWCFEIIADDKGLKCSVPPVLNSHPTPSHASLPAPLPVGGQGGGRNEEARGVHQEEKEDETEKALEGWLGALKSVIAARRRNVRD